MEFDQRRKAFQDANSELIVSLRVLVETKDVDGVGGHVVPDCVIARNDQHVDSVDGVCLHCVSGLSGRCKQVEYWLDHFFNDRNVGIFLEQRGAVLHDDRNRKD